MKRKINMFSIIFWIINIMAIISVLLTIKTTIIDQIEIIISGYEALGLGLTLSIYSVLLISYTIILVGYISIFIYSRIKRRSIIKNGETIAMNYRKLRANIRILLLYMAVIVLIINILGYFFNNFFLFTGDVPL